MGCHRNSDIQSWIAGAQPLSFGDRQDIVAAEGFVRQKQRGDLEAHESPVRG